MLRARRERSIELTWPGKDRLEAHVEGVGWADLEVRERVDARRLHGGAPDDDAPPNMLIAGDNLVAMRALEERYGGRVDLIYIDPPYATGLSYYTQTELGERRAYRDDHAGGMVGYLETMYLRLAAMHRLLAAEGKLFVHCDWRASSMLRVLLDEIFGPECHRNEIIWRRAPNLGRQAASKQLGRVYDSIHVYSKTAGSAFPGAVPKRRAEVPLDRSGKPKGARWDAEREAYFTTAPRGDYTDLSIAKLRREGRVFESSTGTIYIKYFLTLGEDGRWYKEQPVDALWDDFEVRPLRHRPKSEDMGYDTQKPEGLLARIIGWASRPGDRVADFFCGSGTTAAVAERMGRRWIACDSGATAIEVTRRRLLSVGARPFELRTVARVERRRWARRLAGDDVDAVLAAYGAERLPDTRDGMRGDERVTVGPLEGAMDARAIERACERARDRLTVLAWEWDESDPAMQRERARARGVTLALRTIPIELARDDAPRRLRFVERAEIDVVLVPSPAGASVRLTSVRCPDPPPLRERNGQPGDWPDLIAAWWVDFDARAGAFEPSWWSRRDGRAPVLETPAQPIDKPVRVRLITVYGDQIERRIG